MIKKISLQLTVAAAFVAMSATSPAAFATDELEVNDIPSKAQLVKQDTKGNIVIDGAVGQRDPMLTAIFDVDIYVFEAHDGDVVTIDIDNGKKPSTSTERSVDAIVGLFGPGPAFTRLGFNDQSPLATLDEGSISKNDPYLDKIRLNKGDGKYYVAVTSFASFREFRDGIRLSTATDQAGSNGSYRLIVSGLQPSAPPVQVINIDVRPGSTDAAPYNPKAKGNIPVALLSSPALPGSPAFDAMKVKVDRESLTFGATGTEKSLQRCGKDGTDVNGDGLLDLVCHFDNSAVNFDVDHTMGKVMGTTETGELFEGTGLLKIVPMRKE